MKLYVIYLRSKKSIYAYTDNKEYMERFLLERNSNLFKCVTKKIDKSDYIEFAKDKELLKLRTIPLEDSNGDCDIIGTASEENEIMTVCEKFGDTCEYLKLHFTKNVPFNNEYKELLNLLTTISKDINYHPIIQIDSVKLFYHLFKYTFIELTDDEITEERMENFI